MTCLGVGRKVLANDTALVGYCGVGFFFVILLGGTGCIGANLVKPVCSV